MSKCQSKFAVILISVLLVIKAEISRGLIKVQTKKHIHIPYTLKSTFVWQGIWQRVPKVLLCLIPTYISKKFCTLECERAGELGECQNPFIFGFQVETKLKSIFKLTQTDLQRECSFNVSRDPERRLREVWLR